MTVRPSSNAVQCRRSELPNNTHDGMGQLTALTQLDIVYGTTPSSHHPSLPPSSQKGMKRWSHDVALKKEEPRDKIQVDRPAYREFCSKRTKVDKTPHAEILWCETPTSQEDPNRSKSKADCEYLWRSQKVVSTDKKGGLAKCATTQNTILLHKY